MITFINENLVTIFVVAVVVISTLLALKSKPNNGVAERENEIAKLDAIINTKYQELIELNNQIESHQVDKNVSLRKNEVKVLDIYEQSGIRIPSDIIEDLIIMGLNTEREIMNYVENQRAFWKLENTKKPFRRSEAK